MGSSQEYLNIDNRSRHASPLPQAALQQKGHPGLSVQVPQRAHDRPASRLPGHSQQICVGPSQRGLQGAAGGVQQGKSVLI